MTLTLTFQILALGVMLFGIVAGDKLTAFQFSILALLYLQICATASVILWLERKEK
jgi:hypothetical protein